MESLGILLSVPGAFIASVIYAAILAKVAHKLPMLIDQLRMGSYAVLLAALGEFITTSLIGPIRFREIIGSSYYPIHVLIFLLTLPAIATIMRLQNRFEKITK